MCAMPLCGARSVPISLTRLGCVQHRTASVSSRGNRAITAKCLVQNVPPASRSIVHAISKFLQSCSTIKRMVASDTQHHDSHNRTVLEGKLSEERCERGPNFDWLPFDNSSQIQVLRKQGNLSVDIPPVCLGNLSVSILLLPQGSYLVCPY